MDAKSSPAFESNPAEVIDKVTHSDSGDMEIREPREWLSKLNEAYNRINESLDLDSVLEAALAGARALTGARYASISTIDDSGQLEYFRVLGFTPEETPLRSGAPEHQEYYEHINTIPGPLRVSDFAYYLRSMGLSEVRPPVPISSFLSIPIRHRAERVANIHLANSEQDPEFSQEDEEILVMFASQVALVIVNARKHQEERLARAKLETLINTSPVVVVVFEAKTGAPVSFNREARRLAEFLGGSGMEPEDILKVMTARRADGREVSLSESPLVQELMAGETVLAEEIVVGVPDGRSVSVLVNVTPIHADDGRIESVVVTAQDLSPLEETERLRAEFLGMVSHELRTPLTSIRGSASTVLAASSELDPAELRQFLRIIVDQADSMRDLIGDLLDVARIETGTLPVSAEPTDVAVLVDRARNTFLSGGGRDNLEIDLPTNLPLVIVDRRRIVQVISNLLSNAARNSPESSTMRISVARDGIYVAVSVTDEGRGIPAEQLPNLFRKFSRAGADNQGDDTGLGLAICKGIVEAHGGRIWCESQGTGTSFIFTIPAAEETVAELDIPSTQQQAASAERESILVVDDDPQTLRYVRNVLSEAGYAPVVTASAEEALRLMEGSRPSLVLLDMMLPGSDGIELMGDIFGISNVPVIFLSAYGRDHVIARAFQMGASDYIVKPFSPTELVARIRAALRGKGRFGSLEPSEPYVWGDMTIDYAERRITLAGRPVQLTAMEYALIFELSVNGGRVLTHDQLLRRVWGPDKTGDVRSLRTHLRRLRRKLGEDGSNPTYIFSEPRVGYRMMRSSAIEGESE